MKNTATNRRKASAGRQRRRYPLWLEQLEDRCVPSVTGFRPIDDVGNNIDDPTLGTAGTDLLRLSPAAYKPVANGGDGLNIPSMTYGAPTFVAGPRLVSNVVSNQATTLFGSTDINTVDQNGLSAFGYTWGQFLDHDMDLTPTLSGKITAASWAGGVATVTVADGLFRAGDAITVKGMVPAGFNGSFTVSTASVNTDHSTTLTYALATDPGSATTFGTVADTTTKDGSNGFPIPKDPTHTDDPLSVDPDNSLAFTRSIFNTDTGVTSPREQINADSSFLNLSQVYGSTTTVSNALRTLSGGKLKSSPGADNVTGTADDLLPFNSTDYFTTVELAALGMGDDVHAVPSTHLFAAGDVRANETTELTSLHTLFMRNHNRLATALALQNPADFGVDSWTNDTLFQEARKLNIAGYQTITYTGYLPALLGPTALAGYTGYDDMVDPSVSTEFSTIAFRFGHSLLNNTVPRHDNDGASVGDIDLVASFFNPHLLTPGQTNSTSIDAVLKGDADINAQAMDEMAVGSIRNLLFGSDGAGEDLIARDIWRADDHGIGDYNQVRAAFFDFAADHGIDLSPITDTGGGTFDDYVEGQDFHGFEQISSDPAVVTKLVIAFTGPSRNTVPGFLSTGHFGGNINPFIAGLAEDHVPGSDLGPLFHIILVDQFERLRDGDRFFYLNYTFTSAESNLIGAGDTLAEVIKANTSITNLQADVFRFLSLQDGKGKGYYGNNNGQQELTGSQNGTTLTTALYNSLVTALANPDHAGDTVLVDKHGDYVSASSLQSYNFVKIFMQNVSNDNVANKLSVQLLVTQFNVLLGKVDATASIFVPAITLPSGSEDEMSANKQQELKDRGVSNPSGIANIQDLMDAAFASLRAHPDTSDPDAPDWLLQRALKGCFVAINSNQAIFILN